VKSVQEFQRDVQPILDQARHAAADAARVASIAARQAERMDVMLTTVTARVDETLSAVHRIVAGPVTQSAAVWAGLRAVLAMLADRRRGEGDTPEDEDALFVG
jgi:CHASE3 domain sensor protein